MGYGNRLRWSSGRFISDADYKDDNLWLTSSELSLAGRPMAQDSFSKPFEFGCFGQDPLSLGRWPTVEGGSARVKGRKGEGGRKNGDLSSRANQIIHETNGND